MSFNFIYPGGTAEILAVSVVLILKIMNETLCLCMLSVANDSLVVRGKMVLILADSTATSGWVYQGIT